MRDTHDNVHTYSVVQINVDSPTNDVHDYKHEVLYRFGKEFSDDDQGKENNIY